MGLRLRMTATSLAFSLIPFVLVGLFVLLGARDAIITQAFDQLVSVRDIRKDKLENFFNNQQDTMDILLAAAANFQQSAERRLVKVMQGRQLELERYFQMRMRQLQIFGKTQMVAEAMDQFTRQVRGDGERGQRVVADRNWQLLADHYDEVFAPYRDLLGYDDVLLIDADGTIVYTLQRRADLGQHLDTASNRGTSLAEGFNRTLDGQNMVADFEPYPAANGEPRSFLLTAVGSATEVQGVLALSLKPAHLNTQLQIDTGLGETGAVYLVGQLGGVRDFRSAPDRAGASGSSELEHFAEEIELGLAGEFGVATSMGMGDHLRLVAYGPVEIPGVHWTLAVAVDLEAVLAPQLPGEEQDFFGLFVDSQDVHDVFLVHRDGEVFYSVQQHEEHETNVFTGQIGRAHV